MKILITGSSGHLGEGLMRHLEGSEHEAIGLDLKASPYTRAVGSIVDRDFVKGWVHGVDVILHTATLHKPHVATHAKQDFIDTNVTGTLNLLEEAVAQGVGRVIFTSTTSTFGAALTPPPGAPAAWITEDVRPVPKNIYGVTKVAAEDLCELFWRREKLPCLILRTSRFFPEQDDNAEVRNSYEDANLKANELLYRRADLQDIVDAHLLAAERAPAIGFGRYIISATTPFRREDLAELRSDAPSVVERRVPGFTGEYARRGWKMLPAIERVYDNAKARAELGWRPRLDFARCLERLRRDEDPWSPLAKAVGSKGYHDQTFEDGPYPV
ncbi:MAG: NAD(P)-dependent oxidoreductase [Planctomycetota bacterium]